ncbi:MAG: OsmC family protein [Chloroflexota bacterium]
MSAAIASAIAAARNYLLDHPDEARYSDSAATATLDDGLRVGVTGPDGASISTDMPGSVGGTASAPSPGWFLRAAHASCVATLIAMRSAEVGIALRRLEVTVDSESDDRGILGAAEDVPAGPLRSCVTVSIAADEASRPRLRDVVDWAVRHCPVDDAVRRAIPVSLEVSLD